MKNWVTVTLNNQININKPQHFIVPKNVIGVKVPEMFAILEYRLVGNTGVSIYNAKETIDEFKLKIS